MKADSRVKEHMFLRWWISRLKIAKAAIDFQQGRSGFDYVAGINLSIALMYAREQE